MSLIVLLLLLVGSCDKNSATNYYKFPATKDIRATVSIAFKLAAAQGPAVDLSGHSFILNAFALDADGEQVQLAPIGQTPVTNLPVTLPGTQYSFDAVLRVPVRVQPRSDGYALRFSLSDGGTGLKLASSPLTLSARRGSIQAGTTPSANEVDLSIASTLADQILTQSLGEQGSVPALTAYSALVDLLKARQTSVEGSALTTGTPNIAVYLPAIAAGLEYQMLTDKALQAKLIATLSPAVTTGTASEQSEAAQTLATGFTKLLSTYAADAHTRLGSTTTAEFKIFKDGSITPGAVPDPAEYSGVVFAPAAVAFTDTDGAATIGGNVVITPSSVQIGITSYNVYFGGESLASGHTKLAGRVEATALPLSLAVPNGTPVPSGATRFWVFPVTSGGTELNLGTSVVINNGVAIPINLAIAAGNGQNQLSWMAVTGADSYNLYWSTTSPVSTSSNKIAGAASTYVHTGLLAGIYYYAVTAVAGGHESALSKEVSATTASLVAPVTLTAKSGLQLNKLSWTAVSGATGYNVYWSTTSPVSTASTKIAGVTSSPYTQTGLTNGTYYYAVAAIAGGIEGPLSNQASATIVSCNAAITGAFGGGSGTSGDSYTVCSENQLEQVGSTASGIFITLAADLDISATAAFPVQNLQGTFEGNNHVITGLNQNGTQIGLFTIATGAIVKHLGLVAGSVNFFGSSGAYGGLLATQNNGTISGCFATGQVAAQYDGEFGGIAGFSDGAIDNSYANVSVSHDGTGSGGTYFGGIAAWGSGTIDKSYAVWTYTPGGVAYLPGGLLAHNSGAAAVTNSFWDTTVSGVNTSESSSASTMGLTTTQMKDPGRFQTAGWDATAIWRLQSGNYPVFQWQ